MFFEVLLTFHLLFNTLAISNTSLMIGRSVNRETRDEINMKLEKIIKQRN